MILDRTAILLALLCVLVFPNIIRAFLSNGKCLSRDGPYFSKSPEKDKSPNVIVCPGRRVRCQNTDTCCFVPTECTWDCCRGAGPNARCCLSGETCCRRGNRCCPQDTGCCPLATRCNMATRTCDPDVHLRARGYFSIPILKPGRVQLHSQKVHLAEKILFRTKQSQQTKEDSGLTGEY